MSRNSSHNC